MEQSMVIFYFKSFSKNIFWSCIHITLIKIFLENEKQQAIGHGREKKAWKLCRRNVVPLPLLLSVSECMLHTGTQSQGSSREKEMVPMPQTSEPEQTT